MDYQPPTGYFTLYAYNVPSRRPGISIQWQLHVLYINKKRARSLACLLRAISYQQRRKIWQLFVAKDNELKNVCFCKQYRSNRVQTFTK